jgi:ketosteroid isomerase-like protein
MPASTVARLAEAINRGDLDGAATLYEKDAVLVVRPEQIARGRAQVRDALAGFIALDNPWGAQILPR